MTDVLCAINNKRKYKTCFGSKSKTKNLVKKININEMNCTKYVTIQELELASGYIVPENTVLLGWDGHTFGIIDKLEKPIKIPTFNKNNEYVYDSFLSFPSSQIKIQETIKY